VLTDRNRGGSLLSIAIAAVAMFGVFLFLTYYLQQNLGYSPIKTGLAFLPMSLMMMVTAMAGTAKLQARFGPRGLVTVGMALGGVAMLSLTRLDVHSSYATAILPALLMMAVGLGLVFPTAMNNATLGVRPSDAGVASATVNASQQIGGSLGTALLSTIAASATASYLAGSRPTAALAAQAAVHGYTTAFAWSAAIFAAGAIVAAVLYPRGVPALDPAAEPVLVH
jgi:predicted MFS family arabinose efflux permease